MAFDPKSILAEFGIDAPVKSFGSGNINDTYLSAGEPRYILQRINNEVFKDPRAVMENIFAVTEHIRKKAESLGEDPRRATLEFLRTKGGEGCYECEAGFFRVYRFVSDAESHEAASSPDLLYKAAKAFGKFQNMLSDFPAGELHETIPHFHDTASRYNAFLEAVEENKAHRADSVKKEIGFIKSRSADTSLVVDAIEDGSVPLRVTHNDTKLNNVLIYPDTGEGLVIDLDTVMPGSLLYDYGDALRCAASTAAEDESDLSKIGFDLRLFDGFTRGFAEEMKGVFTGREIELLPFSVKLLALELGMRFLTDYLNGDTYFKVMRENHNLDRTRAQLRLVEVIEEKLDEMNDIVSKYI